MSGVHVDEQDDQKAKDNHDDDPKEGHRRVAAHPLKVDGDGNSICNTGVVARKEQRAAKLAHRAGKGEHRAAAIEGHPSGIISLVEMNARTIPRFARRRASACRGPRRLRVPYDRRAGTTPPRQKITAAGHVKTIKTPCAISHRPTPVDRPNSVSGKKAAHRRRQHHRNRKDRIEQALDATRGTHGLPRGEQAQRKHDHQGKTAGLMDTQNGR